MSYERSFRHACSDDCGGELVERPRRAGAG
jgi:hypothetical protein